MCLIAFFFSFHILNGENVMVYIVLDKKVFISHIYIYIHLCLASHTRDICKQCRLRSDAVKCDILSGSTLFALNTGLFIKHYNNKN